MSWQFLAVFTIRKSLIVWWEHIMVVIWSVGGHPRHLGLRDRRITYAIAIMCGRELPPSSVLYSEQYICPLARQAVYVGLKLESFFMDYSIVSKEWTCTAFNEHSHGAWSIASGINGEPVESLCLTWQFLQVETFSLTAP
jgi:hypothetical protein